MYHFVLPGIAVIYNICEDFQLDFYAMYACVGLWNTFFLVLFALFDASKLMKWCTRWVMKYTHIYSSRYRYVLYENHSQTFTDFVTLKCRVLT